jgi:putative intracellular protease/amidase
MKSIATILVLAFFSLSLQAEKTLIVVTNHGSIDSTGQPTGYFFSEVAHPWKVFTDAGYQVDFASPNGGFAPMDPKSFDLHDPANKKLWHNLDAVQSLVHTKDLAQLDMSAYVAVFFAGGHGTMWDFPGSEAVQQAITELYDAGAIIGAVCHGPAALVGVKIDGQPLVKGKKVAAFTNAEEAAVQLTDAMPFLLETKLREQGAEFVPGENFQENIAVDGRLVTGQNPASATPVAQAIVDLL